MTPKPKMARTWDCITRLLKAVIDHVMRAHTTTQIKGMGIGGTRDFELPLESETPRDISDFELVTWLVITTPQS